MFRRVALVALLGLVTACADAPAQTPTTTSEPGNGTSITPAPSVEGTTSTTAPEPDPDLAPDFTLELADGGSFTLYQSERPVYVIFWAEWCPVCRRELPVVDRVAADYADRVDFVAPAWKSAEDAARQVAADLFQSGVIKWGLDPDQVIFDLYNIPFQPVTVLIGSDRRVLEAWAGVRSEDRIRESVDALLAVSGESSP
jgi:thiol-disulfide isomerase/thioredoxin